MKIIVPVKRVVDYNVKIQIKPDNSCVNTDNVKMSMNPFDEIAVEEAIRLKESGKAEEVIIVSIGVDKCQETIRTALAMGADRAIHVVTDLDLEPLSVAKILQKITDAEKPDLIIMGKQAIDNDCNQTGQMLSALLGWPQATFASKLDITGPSEAQVSRETDAGIETVKIKTPAVITTDLRLNEPRYVALPNIMKARSKPLDTKQIDDYGVEVKPHTKVLKVEEPATRTAGIKVETTAELVQKLKEEGAL